MTAAWDDGKDFPLEEFRRNVKLVRRHTLSRAVSLWRSGLAIPAVAQQIGSVVAGGQIATSQLAQVYARKHLRAKFNPFTPGPSILDRPGVDKTYEYMRPAREPSPEDEHRRLVTLVGTDLQLAKTRTFYSAFDSDLNVNRSPIKIFKRVPSGENPCALCEIAADQVYFSTDLMPIHDNCQCDIEEDDGERLSDEQLHKHHIGFVETLLDTGQQSRAIKDLADQDADPEDYHNLVAVRDHGELGPVLTWKGQKFTGPADLPVPGKPRPDPTITTQGPAHEARMRENAARVDQYRRAKERRIFGGFDRPKVAKRVPKVSLGHVDATIGPDGKISFGPLKSNVIPIRKTPPQFDWDKGSLRDGLSYMRDKYAGRTADLTWGPSAGWGSSTFPEAAQRRTLKAIDEMMAKYPDTHVDWFEIRDLGQGAVAETEADLTRPGFTRAMRFDRQLMKQTPERVKEQFAKQEREGFYFKGASEDPYRTMVYHEYGHVLDNRGGWVARRAVTKDAIGLFRGSDIFKDLIKQYPAEIPLPELNRALRNWMGGLDKNVKIWNANPRVSGYSMTEGAVPGSLSQVTGKLAGTSINNAEALAQAFDDVERRGDAAPDLSKLLHRRVTEEAAKPLPEEYNYLPRKASLVDRLPATEQVKQLKRVKTPWSEQEWAKQDNMSLTPEQRTEARRLAEEIYQKAVPVEKAITKAAKAAVAQRGGYMSGLDFRFKTGPSLYRKIQGEFIKAKGAMTLQHVADDIKDAIRYTAIFPAEDQWESGDRLRKALESLGANTIKDPVGIPLFGYRGRNMAFHMHGVNFEMQVNTPLGAAIKDDNHKIYNNSRDLERDLIKAGKDPATDPTYLGMLDKMQENWDVLPITKGTPVVPTEKDVKNPEKILYVAKDTKYRGPTILKGEADIGSPEMIPRERVPATEYGLTWMPDTGWEHVVERARAVPDQDWDTLPVQTLPHGTPILANEGHLKKKSIDKVVGGTEPFREGYVIKLWRDGEGNLHVVDGHTRIAMYNALGKDMPVRVMDEQTLAELVEHAADARTQHALLQEGYDREEAVSRLKAAPDNVRVDVKPLRLIRDIKSAMKELEAEGHTNENSVVRRGLNAAYKGDTAYVARDSEGHAVAIAVVTPPSRYSDAYTLHEFFRNDATHGAADMPKAPGGTGARLLQRIAQDAKAHDAELQVTGAVNTARTYYEQMGGDFEGALQPGGVLTSQSSTAVWSTQARDALAAGKPIPAPHYLIEGKDKNGKFAWVEPPNPRTPELSYEPPPAVRYGPTGEWNAPWPLDPRDVVPHGIDFLDHDHMVYNIIARYKDTEGDNSWVRTAGESWYPSARMWVLKMLDATGSHMPLDKAAAIVAQFSENASWSDNMARAMNYFTGKPTKAFKATDARVKAIAESGDPLSKIRGPKINNFARAILGFDRFPDAVAVDRWAARIALGTNDKALASKILGRSGGYEAMADAYRDAAKQLGIPPSELQAVTWVHAVPPDKTVRAFKEAGEWHF